MFDLLLSYSHFSPLLDDLLVNSYGSTWHALQFRIIIQFDVIEPKVTAGVELKTPLAV